MLPPRLDNLAFIGQLATFQHVLTAALQVRRSVVTKGKGSRLGAARWLCTPVCPLASRCLLPRPQFTSDRPLPRPLPSPPAVALAGGSAAGRGGTAAPGGAAGRCGQAAGGRSGRSRGSRGSWFWLQLPVCSGNCDTHLSGGKTLHVRSAPQPTNRRAAHLQAWWERFSFPRSNNYIWALHGGLHGGWGLRVGVWEPVTGAGGAALLAVAARFEAYPALPRLPLTLPPAAITSAPVLLPSPGAGKYHDGIVKEIKGSARAYPAWNPVGELFGYIKNSLYAPLFPAHAGLRRKGAAAGGGGGGKAGAAPALAVAASSVE